MAGGIVFTSTISSSVLFFDGGVGSGREWLRKMGRGYFDSYIFLSLMLFPVKLG